MNNSFELLSSMSPKLRKGRQKTLKKAIKILALKKQIRRSSIYDKAPAVNNEDLAIVENSTESSESSYYQRNMSAKENEQNNVVIIDSTDSEDMEDQPKPNSNIRSSKLLRNNEEIETKVDRINRWLDNIDLDEKKDDNLTFFSQVSTIYGDEAPKFDPDGNGLAASSTFNDYLTRRFDELFVTDKKGRNIKPKDDLISDDSFSIEINTSLESKLKRNSQKQLNKSSDSEDLEKVSNDREKFNDIKTIVDETLLTSDESLVKLSNCISNSKLTPARTPEQFLRIDEDFVTTRKKKVTKLVQEPQCSPLSKPEEMETILDSLYGKKWREKQNHVLPLSEPKKKQDMSKPKIIFGPSTERVIKTSNKEIIRNNLNPASKKLNFDNLRKPIVSPWVQRLKGLVDSDSDTNVDCTNEGATAGLENIKKRLTFCDDSPSRNTTNKIKTNHTEIGHKEINFDDSLLSESLEERIKRKMNNINVPSETRKNINKTGGKVTKDNKENNPNSENQVKSKGTLNGTEKPLLEDGISKKKSSRGLKKGILASTRERSSSSSSTNSCNEIEISSDEEYDMEVTKMYEVKRKSMLPTKDGSYTFLESLSGHIPLNKCDVSARIFRTSFKHYRDELKMKLFFLYNEKVFENAIPRDTELEWNDKLRNTAGLCYCKKVTHRGGKVIRKVKIVLSSKVLDSADRLRDTLIHEMCHAGTWIINQISNGHGVYWKNWAFKAMRAFPELPPIKRCHTYQINTKYTYKCTGCGYSFGRHSKSLDIERKRCGHCYGKFEILLNKTSKTGETKSVPATPRKEATGFALFVKENYARYKEPSKKHGDVMKILGKKFSEMKLKNPA